MNLFTPNVLTQFFSGLSHQADADIDKFLPNPQKVIDSTQLRQDKFTVLSNNSRSDLETITGVSFSWCQTDFAFNLSENQLIAEAQPVGMTASLCSQCKCITILNNRVIYQVQMTEYLQPCYAASGNNKACVSVKSVTPPGFSDRLNYPEIHFYTLTQLELI